MRERQYRGRHLALLISILLFFTATPILIRLDDGLIILRLLAAAVIISASYALSDRKRVFVAAIVLSALSLLTGLLLWEFRQRWAIEISHACIIALIAFFLVNIFSYVIRAGKVTADKIFAAICVYLLIGYCFGFTYALLDQIAPDSFAPALKGPDFVTRGMQLRYFSFTTLTTVGYGDVVPHSSAARTLAMLEAVTGQMYLAVLIARLVGLHIVHGLEREEQK